MAPEKVTEMILNVDLKCSGCYKKVKKVLCKFPQIREQVFEMDKNMVKIKVVCCSPENIRDKLCGKGGHSIRSIEIIEKPKDPTETPEVNLDNHNDSEEANPKADNHKDPEEAKPKADKLIEHEEAKPTTDKQKEPKEAAMPTTDDPEQPKEAMSDVDKPMVAEEPKDSEVLMVATLPQSETTELAPTVTRFCLLMLIMILWVILILLQALGLLACR